MNFNETMQSVELILAANQVPLLVGQTGIGKTSLAAKVAAKKGWALITIDGNLLKEGEIGGLPTIDIYRRKNRQGQEIEEKATVYAIHHKLRDVDKALADGKEVLLFIDEINRCEHAVQQELMNLILNREINGYDLPDKAHIIAAMNPSDSYDYEATDMDAAQENRFVWLYMEADYMQWLQWALEVGIDEKVIDFISTYPDYLNKVNEDDINATPRSYERVSGLYKIYKNQRDEVSSKVFFNVIRGNVGKLIAQEFVNFVESDYKPLLSYEEVFEKSMSSDDLAHRLEGESQTRLYLGARNMLQQLERHISDDLSKVPRYLETLNGLLQAYPVDLRIAIMKDIRNSLPTIYQYALEDKAFVDTFFDAYR